MLTTPMVARFQSSAASTAGRETLKVVRSRSFKLRTTCRRSLIDCAASMWSSRVRKAIGISFEFSGFKFQEIYGNHRLPGLLETRNWKLKLLRNYFGRDPRRDEGLDNVAGLDVAVIGDGDAALHAIGDFFRVIFKTPQRSDLAFDHNHVVAEQADLRITLDQSIDHAATGHRSHLRDAEGLEHLGAALVGFLDRGLEQAAHRAL